MNKGLPEKVGSSLEIKACGKSAAGMSLIFHG
jgi:hypothetical protein